MKLWATRALKAFFRRCSRLRLEISPPSLAGEVAHFAVAIIENGPTSSHLGAFYRGEDGLRLLHLAFHMDVRDEPAPSGFFWHSLTDLDMFVAEQIAATFNVAATLYANKPANERSPLQYSFANDPEFVGPDLTVGSTLPGTGYTCSTFVLRILENIGIMLIDRTTWKARAEDADWQSWIIECLIRKYGDAVADHVKAMRKEIGAFRIRPADVVAAASLPREAKFADIEQLVGRVESSIRTTE